MCLACCATVVHAWDLSGKCVVLTMYTLWCPAELPPGRFWELNAARDCPKGLYRENYVLVTDKVGISCLPCPRGWTTPGIGTPAIGLCNSECLLLTAAASPGGLMLAAQPPCAKDMQSAGGLPTTLLPMRMCCQQDSSCTVHRIIHIAVLADNWHQCNVSGPGGCFGHTQVFVKWICFSLLSVCFVLCSPGGRVYG